MAVMYPQKLSKDAQNDPRKKGEIKFYNCLKNRLGNDWTVFYNVLWFGRVYKSGDKRDGESDFIIVNPKYGVIIAEVKGGEGIGFDGNSGQWYSINRLNKRNIIKDPYSQGRQNKYALIEEIKTLRAWKDGVGGINICNIVVFPESSKVTGSLPIHAKKELTIFEDDLISMGHRLIETIRYACNEYNTDINKTQTLIGDLTKTLAPKFEASRKLVNYFAEDEEEIITLTEAQYSTLRGLQKVKRASISGCAGSGKSLLAVKKAQMLIDEGKTILLCCFNTLLGKRLENLITNKYCTSGNFHSIVHKIMTNVLKVDCNTLNTVIYNDDKLIDLIMQHELPSYDGIIVDELQDFSKNQVEILEIFLKKDSVFYCFWDNNQKLLRSDFTVPNNMTPYELDTNLRNTRNIFNEVKKHYYQETPMTHKGPKGKKVKYCSPYNNLSARELRQKISNELHEMIFRQGVSPKEITILTFKSKEQSALYDFKVPGLKFDIFNNEFNEDTIKIETVRRYKGLEASVIIVTEMDDFNATGDSELWDNLCYVSFSRAKHYLIVIPPNNIKLENELEI